MARGRTPEAGSSRDSVVCVRFTPAEALHLDKIRGERSRSAYIRDQVALSGSQVGKARK